MATNTPTNNIMKTSGEDVFLLRDNQRIAQLRCLFSDHDSRMKTYDTSMDIQEGDVVERSLPNGATPTYLVVQSSYSRGMGGSIPPSYVLNVRKTTTIDTNLQPASHYYHGVGAVHHGSGDVSDITQNTGSAMTKRESVQMWFRQHFVFEGIDRLVADVTLAQYQIGLIADKVAKPKESYPIPTDAIARISQLVGTTFLDEVFISMHMTIAGLLSENLIGSHCSDSKRMWDLYQIIGEIKKPLADLQSIISEWEIAQSTDTAHIRKQSEVVQIVQTLHAAAIRAEDAFTGERCMIQMMSKSGILGQ